ncbi:hypothetical protein ACSNOI_02560 [Actinomadura kijaniata]|uniref:hypothetical protein n=1 Tax=Actinomadura kijaniata TaxID=46161 RepID=UPI003F1D11FA
MAANIPVNSLIKLAMGQFSTSTGIAQSAGFTLLASATAIANVPGMYQSAAEWMTLQNSIDEIKSNLDQVYVDVKADWIAEDRDSFSEAVQAFKKELDDVKSYLLSVNMLMEAVATTYAGLWLALAALAAIGLAFLLLMFAMMFTPYAPAAKAKAEMIGGWMSTLTNVFTKVAATAIAAMTGVLGMATMGLARAMGVRVGAAPTGGATGREDFRQVTIDYKAPSVYVVPNKQLPA